MRARPSGRPLKGISARPGRYPRWKRQACSVFGGSKVQSAFHVARFHLPCSGTVFLYTAPEAADVVHEIEYRLIPVFACHRVQAGAVVPQYCPAIGCLTVQRGENAVRRVVKNRRPPESFRQWPARCPGSHSPSCFLNSPGLLPRANPSMACMVCCISWARTDLTSSAREMFITILLSEWR